MSRYDLEHLADDSIDDGLHSQNGHDRQSTADLLAFIAESDRRRRYAQFGYGSMKEYCVKVLRLSDDAAAKRIQVARKARFLPMIFEAIADGRVHLTGMRQLVPFIDDENVNDLIAAATHRTYREIEWLLAALPLHEFASVRAFRCVLVVAGAEQPNVVGGRFAAPRELEDVIELEPPFRLAAPAGRTQPGALPAIALHDCATHARRDVAAVR